MSLQLQANRNNEEGTGSSQLQVQINPADLANPGYAEVTVTNPGPGGGTSNVAEFQILYQPAIVNQATNDLVWDPLNQVIYISVPGLRVHMPTRCVSSTR
jgi:hypothetical protein